MQDNYQNNKNSIDQSDEDKMMEKILTRTSEYAVPEGTSKDIVFEKLMQKIDSGAKTIPVKNKRINYIYWSAAAVLLILIGLSIFFLKDQAEKISASNGSQVEYRLPDGSVVYLNAGSEITFSKNNFTEKRKLSLTGEAFFEVEKGKRFVISTDQGNVEILGTSLNVYSRKTIFNVTCLTGKVLVISGNQSEIITKGEQVIKKEGKLVKTTEINSEKVATWRKGVLNFVNTSLISIFEELERQYNITISASGLDNKYFSGPVTNKNLKEALDIICIPMNLDYEILTDNKVVIKSKKN
jgi:transmembrane sensor